MDYPAAATAAETDVSDIADRHAAPALRAGGARADRPARQDPDSDDQR